MEGKAITTNAISQTINGEGKLLATTLLSINRDLSDTSHASIGDQPFAKLNFSNRKLERKAISKRTARASNSVKEMINFTVLCY